MNSDEIKNETLRLIEGAFVEFSNDEKKPDGPRKFTMLAYSGQPVLRSYGSMVIDLAGLSVGKKTPILKNHDAEQIVGMGDKIEKTSQALAISGTVSKKTDAAKEVCELADEGFDWQASVGIDIQKLEFLSSDVTTMINGREVKGPMVVVRQSRLRESSFVPVGADEGTSGVVLSYFKEKETMSKEAVVPAATDEAEKKAREAERGRFSALTAKFPKHPAFVGEQFSKGNSVEQAEIEFKDVLIAEKDAELAALKKNPPAPAPAKLPGVAPVAFTAAQGGESGGGEGADFTELVENYATEKKVSKGDAIAACVRLYPDKHTAYVDACRNGTAKLIRK